MTIKTSGIVIGIALSSFLTLSSCGGLFSKGGVDSVALNNAIEKSLADNVNEVKVSDGNYKINIPKHLSLADSLNSDASLQYEDAYNELYIIVINEKKDEFKKLASDPETDLWDNNLSAEKNYRMIKMKSFLNNVNAKAEPFIKKTTINGLDAELVDFTAKVEGIDVDIYYKTAFVEGPDYLYMVMTWTLDSNKNKNNEEMDAMLNSFKVGNAK